MSRGNKLYAGLALLALLALVIIPFSVEAPRLLFGKAVSDLPTGLFPMLAAAGILLFSLVEYIHSRDTDIGKLRPVSPVRIKTIIPLALIILAAASLDFLGYLITMVLAAAALSLTMGNRNPLLLAAGSISVPVLIYWLITRFFSTYLPAGIVMPDVFS